MTLPITIDLETIPDQSEGVRQEFIDQVTAPGNYKKPESIEKWLAENSEDEGDKQWRKTALDFRGEILSISWAIEDSDINTHIQVEPSGERDVLLNFWEQLASAVHEHQLSEAGIIWVGHNICGFDLRLLWQRTVINGLRPTVKLPYDAKPWSDRVFDTYYEWAGLGGKGKLDEVAGVLGYEGEPDGLDGSKIYDAWKDGRIDEIIAYNQNDVKKARYVYKRLTGEI